MNLQIGEAYLGNKHEQGQVQVLVWHTSFTSAGVFSP
jgi:hypothetical protein